MNRSGLIASIVFASISLAPIGAHVVADEKPLAGYSVESSRTEKQWEEKMRALPKPKIMRENMQRLAARPHHVGSPYDKDNAEWILAKSKNWGSTPTSKFECFFPRPKSALSNCHGDRVHRKATGTGGAGDPTSNQTGRAASSVQRLLDRWRRDRAAGLRQFRRAGGLRELERMGVSVKGAIVIARTTDPGAASSRKLPPSMAPSAASSIPIRTKTAMSRAMYFPKARAAERRRAARQRDGHAALSRRSADAGRRRHQGREAPGHEGSSDDHQDSRAADLLRRRAAAAGRATGPWRPRHGAAGCRITYHIGPGPAKVHLKVKSNWDMKPIYDIIARIPGSRISR